MGIEPEKIEQILEMHKETLESIKADKDKAVEQAEKYKADAEKLTEVQKELESLKDISEKYGDLKSEFDKYKGEQTAKETKANKTKAFKKLLNDAKVSKDVIELILEGKNFDEIELDDNGGIKDAENVTKQITEKYAKFIETEGAKGAKTSTPPTNNGGKMTKEQIMAITDKDARQAAMLENIDLFD